MSNNQKDQSPGATRKPSASRVGIGDSVSKSPSSSPSSSPGSSVTDPSSSVELPPPPPVPPHPLLPPPLPPLPPHDCTPSFRSDFTLYKAAIEQARGKLAEAARLLDLPRTTLYNRLNPESPLYPLRAYSQALRIYHFGQSAGHAPAFSLEDRPKILQAWEASEHSPRKTAKLLKIPYSTCMDLLVRMQAPDAPASPRFNKDGTVRKASTLKTKTKKPTRR